MNDEARLLSVPPEEIRTYQLDRLRQTLERARRAPYFAERFAGAAIDKLDDLARLPLTTKEDLREASPFGSVAVPAAELFQYHESFGTSGKPVASWLTRNDFEAYAQQINQCALNFGPEDLVVNKFPYAISVPAHIVKLAAQNRGACVVSASSLSPVCPYLRALDLMHKLRATVLTCLPTEATLLGAAAVTEGQHPARDYNLRAIGAAGELLTDARRRRIAAQWNCQVYNYYGTTETGNLASDCSHGNLHLAWDHFLCEVVDPQTHALLPPGAIGMPAITTLTREAMPLLRYGLSGDLVRLETAHECPCGRRAPIVRHYGRNLNRFDFHGRSVSMPELEDRLFRYPVDAVGDIWMIVITDDRIYFRVEAARPDPAVYREAEKQVRAEFDVPLTIDAVAPYTLIPKWLLQEPARIGKPQYYCHAKSLAEAPPSLPDLWMGPGGGDGPPPKAG